MKQTLELGTVLGVRVRVHWTLLILLLGLFAWLLWHGQPLGVALRGLWLTVLLFGCVVLHELGHALAAMSFNVRTIDVTLYPVGGIARLEHMPRDPKQELIIAAAGPAVNLAIALVLAGVALFGSAAVLGRPSLSGPLNSTLMWMNLALVVFNLIPAFPMDGGRVFRAVLAMRLAYSTATRIAVWTAQVLALVFALVAVLSVPGSRGFNPVLLLVAAFVFFAAREEMAHVAGTSD